MDKCIYSGNVRKVESIIVGILSPDEIRRRSVCEVSRPLTQDKDTRNTVRDARLGVIEFGSLNPITQLDNISDTGNFGHLELAKPVIVYPFFDKLIKILNCVCHDCKTVKIPRLNPAAVNAILSKPPKLRIAAIQNLNKGKSTNLRCPNCGVGQPKFKKIKKDSSNADRILTIGAKFTHSKGEEAQNDAIIFDECMILWILESLSDEDVYLLGMNPNYSHPAWMIWTVMPVSPMTMRPSVKQDNGKSSEDDLTHKYVDIIRINARLREVIEKQRGLQKQEEKNALNVEIVKFWDQLRYHCATLIDNDSAGLPKAVNRSQRPLKTIKQRITPKAGRIRGNLMGKRVDGTARTVISPNPEIEMDQISVPILIAMTLTIPETVSKYNIDFLTGLVRNGISHPGAKYVTQTRGRNTVKLYLGYTNRENIQLQYGDIVNRFLMDDDWILFNRQPSLHRMSIMCHRVKISEAESFGMQLSVTPPYNADFDGDEMNMHILSSTISSTEAAVLMHVPTQIVSPQAGKAIMGLVQDGVVGSYRLSKSKKPISWLHTMRYLSKLKSYNGKLPVSDFDNTSKGPTFKSLDIISYLLPNISAICPGGDDHPVKIITGIIEPGAVFTKGTVGPSRNGLMHIINNDCGPYEAKKFCDDMATLTNKWLADTGFSVGMADVTISKKYHNKIQNVNIERLNEIDNIIMKFRTGQKNQQDVDFDVNSLGEQMERDVMDKLTALKNETQKLAIKFLKRKEQNHFLEMVLSGAKGSSSNAAQIVAGLGQQDIDAQRILDDFPGRPTGNIMKYDYSSESRGFVRSSYGQGLNPLENLYHSKAGRVGIVSTSIGTAETGYLQRKTIKRTEDLHVAYDGTVRSETNRIVQFLYGYDGFNGVCIEKQDIDENLDIMTFQQKYRHTPSTSSSITEEEFNKLLYDRLYVLNHVKRYGSKDKYDFIVNFKRLLMHTRALFKLDNTQNEPLDVDYIINSANLLMDEIEKCYYDDVDSHSNMFFKITLRQFLSSKNIIETNFSKQAFDYMLNIIRNKFFRGRIEAGESVGIIASQSIGEPSTQMTLNVFHNTGVGQKANVTRGIPRFTEIYNASPNPKTPSMTVFLKESYLYTGLTPDMSDDDIIKIIENRISTARSELEYVTIRDVMLNPLDRIRLINNIEEDEDSKIIEFNQEVIEAHHDNFEKLKLVKIVFDRKKMYYHKISMQDIEVAVVNIGYTDIIVSDDSSNVLLMYVAGPEILNHDNHISNILEARVKGIYGIGKCSSRTISQDVILPSGRILNKNNAYSSENGIFRNDETGISFVKIKVIDTAGSNILKVLSLPFVDSYNTVSNHIREVDDTYGIEAARAIIIDEFQEILESAGSNVDPRHIFLLADLMTHQGEILAINRYGMRGTDNKILAVISFEEPYSRLADAAMYSFVDDMQGVSGNIMFAQPVKVGTGMFDTHLDEDMIFSNLNVSGHGETDASVSNDIVDPEDIVMKIGEMTTNMSSCAAEDLTMSFAF